MSNSPNFQKSRTPRRLQSAAPQKRTWRQTPAVWVLGLVLLAAVITVAVSAGGSDAEDPRPQTAFAEVLGTPLAPFSEPDPAIGQALPTLSARSISGEQVTLGVDGVGRVIGFFAHWCPHCQQEVPRVTSWLATNELPANVEVIAVSTGVDAAAPNYPPLDWFEREGWPAEVLLDSSTSTLATALGLPGYPFWVVVDADATVINRVSGVLTADEFGALVDQASAASAS